jgi:hypothetical protein
MIIMKANIRSNEFPYNMSGWLTEKAQNVLWELSILNRDLSKRDDLPEGLLDNIHGYLYPILNNSTKILSFACGGKWSTKDAEIILEQGMDGYEKILVRYKLLDETGKDKTERERRTTITNFITRLNALLNEPRDTARPQIHELLIREGFDDHFVKEISDLTEKVTMGEISWGEY